MTQPYRYYVRSPDGRAIFGFDKPEAAEFVALEYGIGAAVVDTLAQAYMPMLQLVDMVEGKPRLVLGPIGGWDTGRFGLDRDLVEAVKKGHAALVHAFLAKGAQAGARDMRDGTPLHWAAARGGQDLVELLLAHGAEAGALDQAGRSPADVAEGRGHGALATLLRQKIAT